jgi:hypothetical protein
MAIAPVGLLVIRAWVEEGSEQPLRVHVRLTSDTGRGFERELVFTEPAPVEALVRGWLAQAPAETPIRAPGAADRADPVTRRSRHGHGAGG